MKKLGLALSVFLLVGCLSTTPGAEVGPAFIAARDAAIGPTASPSQVPTPAPTPTPSPDYYPVAVGAKWTYRYSFDGKVVGEQTYSVESAARYIDALRFTVRSSVKLDDRPESFIQSEYTRDAEGVFLEAGGLGRIPVMRFPVESGKTWSHNNGFNDATYIITVEDVSTPYGVFKDTFCITKTYGKAVSKDWYAAGIGMVRTESVDMSVGYSRFALELTSYFIP